jgi:uncharacterized membrane protein YoaT (DUF817 family)
MKHIFSQVLTGLIALASLLSVAFLWKHNLILLIVLILLATLMLLMNKSKRELKTFIFCAISGAIAEGFAVFLGAWTYANPNLLNIPIWLIVLWGIASVFVVRVYFFFGD